MDGTTEAFLAAAADPGVAVVVLTGSEDSFSAGQDLIEMAQLATGTVPSKARLRRPLPHPDRLPEAADPCGQRSRPRFRNDDPRPLDLVFASTNARFKCPFTALGVAPELSSSMTFPASLAVRTQAGS